MLEKWQCHECEKGWLLISDDTKEHKVCCPYCGTSGDNVENTAIQADDDDYKNEMGCLWPGYNEFDQLSYMIRKGMITTEQVKSLFSK